MSAARVLTYKPEVFSNLPDLHDSLDHFKTSQIVERDFAPLFFKHKVSDCVALSLMHRHYSICQHERVVEKIDTTGDKVQFICSPEQAHTLGDKVVPYLVKYHEGEFVPLEFTFHEQSNAKELYERVIANEAFLKEFSEMLVKHNLQDTLGLILTHRFDFISQGTVLSETTVTKARTSTTVPLSDEEFKELPEEAVIPAHWSFTLDGKGQTQMCVWCCTGCLENEAEADIKQRTQMCVWCCTGCLDNESEADIKQRTQMCVWCCTGCLDNESEADIKQRTQMCVWCCTGCLDNQAEATDGQKHCCDHTKQEAEHEH